MSLHSNYRSGILFRKVLSEVNFLNTLYNDHLSTIILVSTMNTYVVNMFRSLIVHWPREGKRERCFLLVHSFGNNKNKEQYFQ